MMRVGGWIGLVVTLAIGGCYNPSIPAGSQPCSMDQKCPEGMSCFPDQRCYPTGSSPSCNPACTGEKPVCNPATLTCVGCLVDGDCPNVANGTLRCTSGQCVIASCSAGNFADCDGKPQTGCESNVSTDPKNCGACKTACGDNQTCTNSKCFTNCTAPMAECDGNPTTVCEANLSSDPANCGACKMACGPDQTCSDGKCIWGPPGPQQNVSMDKLAGWTVCYQDTYDISLPVATVVKKCTGSKLMLACRPNNAPTITLLAWAPRVDVLTDTGMSNTPHVANKVGWYFSATYSWGFAAAGDPIARTSCDVTPGANRLCWHTVDNAGGYRCGDVLNLNVNKTWDRLVLQAD